MTETQTRQNRTSSTIVRTADESMQPLRAELLTAEHTEAFLLVVVEELMGDANRVPATIRRKQLFADMMLLFHMHITGKGKSSVDIAKAAHVDLAVVKQMLTPLVELGLLRWEYRGNHASRHGSGRVRHYAFTDSVVEKTLALARGGA